jgi:hypothetical protein
MGGKAYPGLKPQGIGGFERAKAKALAYPEANTEFSQKMVCFVLSVDRLWLKAKRLQRSFSLACSRFLISTFNCTELGKTLLQF